MEAKIKIGVLMGGLSIEREVSFSSGRTVCDHLDTTLYQIIPLFQTKNNQLFILPWRFLHRGKISDFEDRLEDEAQEIKWDQLSSFIDFAFIAQHGRYAENGSIQGFLEILKIPYLGSKVLGSALGMDKALQRDFLTMAGINVPQSIIIQPQDLDSHQTNDTLAHQLIKKNISLPVVVKPAQEGSSLGVSVVFKEDELLKAVHKAATIMPEIIQPVLLEERIEGMEFTCVILVDPVTKNPIPFPITEVLYEPGHYIHGYEQKYMPGRSIKFTPARCSQENREKIYATCWAVMKALDFATIGRIDGFLKNDGSVVIIDPNTLCGLAPSGFFFTQAACLGMSHSDVINYLIKLELQGYGMGTQISSSKKIDQKNDQKIRVGVLLGGPSNEKETSLDSGRNVCYKLSPHKYSVLPLFVDKNMELYPLTQDLLVLNATSEIEHKIDRSTRINWHDLPKLIDFAFIALHGGPGENGQVQGTLEMLQIPYNGSGIAASALCLDKYKTTTLLRAKGFDAPHSKLITNLTWTNSKESACKEILKELYLPLIVKPHDDGCSVMVQKVETQEALMDAIETIFSHDKNAVLVEEWIKGIELTVGVIGNDVPQALPPSQVVLAGDILSIEEKFLPGAGENKTPAPLPEKTIALIKSTMEQVYKTAGCSGYARIDCFYQSAQESPTGQERVITLEINSLPGLTPATCIFHQAAEINMRPMDFIDLIVTLGFEKHKGYQPIESVRQKTI